MRRNASGATLARPLRAALSSLGISAAVAILEADPRVFRYAWFGAGDAGIPNVALTASGGRTALGDEYASLPVAP